MARYDRGYDYRGGYRDWHIDRGRHYGYARRPDMVDGVGRNAGRGYRSGPGERPWVGGYREGYQGGSGGIPTSRGLPPEYDRDYWWLGEHEMRRHPRYHQYDRGYQRFDERNHPRYSPVGGTYGAMGGEYAYHRPPRPLRDDTWFSDWTRWF